MSVKSLTHCEEILSEKSYGNGHLGTNWDQLKMLVSCT